MQQQGDPIFSPEIQGTRYWCWPTPVLTSRRITTLYSFKGRVGFWDVNVWWSYVSRMMVNCPCFCDTFSRNRHLFSNSHYSGRFNKFWDDRWVHDIWGRLVPTKQRQLWIFHIMFGLQRLIQQFYTYYELVLIYFSCHGYSNVDQTYCRCNFPFTGGCWR